LKGYKKANGTENIVKASSQKYIAPFRPLTAPQVLKAVKDSLDANSGLECSKESPRIA